MKTILVTGPIGSGKSVVCKVLRGKGYPVYDSDSRAKALYTEIPGLKETIEKALGISFDDLGIIFRDRARRDTLESILYPLVRKDFERWKESQDSGVVFFESAVAACKPQFEGCFDCIWMVEAPLELRKTRNPKAVTRNASQDFSSIKADVTIVNDGNIEQLKQKIESIL